MLKLAKRLIVGSRFEGTMGALSLAFAALIE